MFDRVITDTTSEYNGSTHGDAIRSLEQRVRDLEALVERLENGRG